MDHCTRRGRDPSNLVSVFPKKKKKKKNPPIDGAMLATLLLRETLNAIATDFVSSAIAKQDRQINLEESIQIFWSSEPAHKASKVSKGREDRIVMSACSLISSVFCSRNIR
jgi:hypothetical protein